MHFAHHPRFPRRRRAQFPLALLEDGKDLAVRTDLESCGVEICNMEASPTIASFSLALTGMMQVPALFVENFDYENMRPDFVNGVLTSDLLGKTFRCNIIGEKNAIQSTTQRAQPWAAHIGDLSSYGHLR